MNFLLKTDKEEAIQFIRGNIMRHRGDRSDFVDYNKVIELQAKELVDALFEHLDEADSSDDPKMVLDVAKILLSYQDSDLNKRVFKQINKIVNRIKERTILPYETFLIEND